MKKLLLLLVIFAFSFSEVMAQEKNEMVLGLRFNPSITWNQGSTPEAGISLNIEHGYILNHTYLSLGYSPVNNVLYSFNEY